MFFTENISSDAKLSKCGRYRYYLERHWSPALALTWIMLNPSTADTKVDDPTIKRCISFAKKFDYGGIKVYNLFAWRATDPAEILLADDPIGPDNDKELQTLFSHQPGRIVAAWGEVKNLRVKSRVTAVIKMMPKGRRLYCLGTTQAGDPRHPLYMPDHSQLTTYWC